MKDPSYWEGVYRNLGPSDVFEWGSVSFQDLSSYEYKLLGCDDFRIPSDNQTRSSSLQESLRLSSTSSLDQPVLILGCGNSTLGEDMLKNGWKGPIVQVDVASRVIESMSQRCAQYLPSGDMQIVQDDATILSAFQDDTLSAAIDKGLIDALFCTEDYEQCYQVMMSVHRVLKPDSYFGILSFSRPEFLLPKLLIPSKSLRTQQLWKGVQIQQLPGIILYLFHKEARLIPKSVGRRKQR